MRAALAVAACLSGAGVALAAGPAAGERVSFVSCPIVRDTSTVPCWLSEYEGVLYFLTLQTDVSAPVNPPWLGHKVLVEGVVADEPDICGGRVLKPVALSVMQELDGSCNTLLPAEDRYNLTFEPPRPPGPSRGRLAFGDPAPKSRVPSVEMIRDYTLQYEFDGMVASLEDMTERARLDRELRKYRENLEDLVRQRTEELVSAFREAGIEASGNAVGSIFRLYLTDTPPRNYRETARVDKQMQRWLHFWLLNRDIHWQQGGYISAVTDDVHLDRLVSEVRAGMRAL